MKNWSLTLGMVVAGCAVFLGYRALAEGLVYQKSVAEQIDGGRVNDGALIYENKHSKYKVSIPVNWGYAEAEPDGVFESRVEITPPEGNLKVKSINVDVMKRGIEAKELYTVGEFEKWDKMASDTDMGGITKLGEELVSGEKVLLLADLTKVGDSPTDNEWSVLGWFRHKDKNYYVRMFGRQDFTDADEQVFRYLLGTMELLD